MLNSGPGKINFSLEGKKYSKDSVISISVEIIDNTKSRFGFQLTALDDNNNKAGSFTIGPKTGIASSMGREYIAHQTASGTKTWQFDWTAPSSNVGPITFFLAANAANANGSNSGDNIYTRSYMVEPTSPVSTKEIIKESIDFVVYPNPIIDRLNIVLPSGIQSEFSIRLFNMKGELIYLSESIAGYNQEEYSFNVDSDIVNSMYILVIYSEQQKAYKKILVKR